MRLRGSFGRLGLTSAFMASMLLVASGLTGCGDDSGGEGGGGGSSGSGSIQGRLCIDRVTPAGIVPPAGVKVGFRVLSEYGEPLRPLVPEDVVVYNDEKGTPFGSGSEGDAVSNVAPIDDVELYSVLALDFSSSIVNNGVVDDMIDGAIAYVHAVVTKPEAKFKHSVAIVVFGAPDETGILLEFTKDDATLKRELDDLRSSPSLGSTDLYGAYLGSLGYLLEQGGEAGVIERFLVLLTDGTHEAGNAAALREAALTVKRGAPATIYTIGVQGNYDACGLEELAGRGASTCGSPLGGCREGLLCNANSPPPPSCPQFISQVDPAALEGAFQSIAERAAGISRSNYEIAVCTPVAIGSSSLTLEVTVDRARDTEVVPYAARNLTGAVQSCDPQDVLDAEPLPGGGGGGGGGSATTTTSSGAGGAGGAPERSSGRAAAAFTDDTTGNRRATHAGSARAKGVRSVPVWGLERGNTPAGESYQ